MKNLKRHLGLAMIVGALAGCANNATLKLPADLAQPNKKIEVVAIAAPYPAEVGFSETSLFFGALADAISGQNYRDQLAKKMASLLGNWRAEDMLREKYERQLAAKGYQIVGGKDIQPLPAAVAYDPQKGMGDIDAMSQAVTAWHGPEKTIFDHSRRISQYRPDAIIEVGYGSYRIDKRYGDRSITINVQAKIIRPATGDVIARNRSYVVGGLMGGTPNHAKLADQDLTTDSGLRQFVAGYKTVLEQETEQLVKESIDSMGL
jgi:hypothetical protein